MRAIVLNKLSRIGGFSCRYPQERLPRAIGGSMTPNIAIRLMAGIVAFVLLDVPTAAALTTNGGGIIAGSQPISYHGGPVLQPTIGCLMWSPPNTTGFSAADVETMNQYLAGVQQYLSNWNFSASVGGGEPTVRQYGVWGAQFGGACSVDNANIPTTQIPWLNSGSTIRAEIARAQLTLGLPHYGPETVILVFTKGIPFDSNYGTNMNGCAFHTFFGTPQQALGTGQYYALIPYPTNTACINGNALNEFQTLGSHEILEAATNPMTAGGPNVSSWYYDPKPATGEVADGCPGALLTFPDGSSGYVSQAVDNISGACQSFSPEQTIGISAVKTGTNTVNLIVAGSHLGITHVTGDGTNWNLSSTLQLNGQTSEAPSAVSADSQTMDVYVRGTDSLMYQQRFENSQWIGWLQMTGATVVGPPAAVYRTSTGLEDVWTLGPDGKIYFWSVVPATSAYTVRATPMPSGVLAVTPPRIQVMNSDCYVAYFVSSSRTVFSAQMCSTSQTISYSSFTPSGPELISSVQDFATPNAITSVLFGNLMGSFGGSEPELNMTKNGHFDGYAFPNVVGPVSAFALGTKAVAVARGLGANLAPLYGMTSAINTAPNQNTFAFSAPSTLATGVKNSPYLFSVDGQTADVFYNLNQLQHIRFNGSTWLASQALGLAVQ